MVVWLSSHQYLYKAYTPPSARPLSACRIAWAEAVAHQQGPIDGAPSENERNPRACNLMPLTQEATSATSAADSVTNHVSVPGRILTLSPRNASMWTGVRSASGACELVWVRGARRSRNDGLGCCLFSSVCIVVSLVPLSEIHTCLVAGARVSIHTTTRAISQVQYTIRRR